MSLISDNKKLINVLLVVLVVLIWGSAGIKFFQSSSDEMQAQKTGRTFTELTSLDEIDQARRNFRYESVQRNPFDWGSARPVQSQKEPEPARPVQRRNPLQEASLNGIIYKSDHPIAIVHLNQKSHYLTTGDSLLGFRVQQVFQDSLIFTDGQQNFVLRLNR